MKNKFLLCLSVILGVFLNIVFADIIPEGEKIVNHCVIIENLNKFPYTTVVAETKAVQGFATYDVVLPNKCLSGGYKFNALNLYYTNKTVYKDSINISGGDYINLTNNINRSPYSVSDKELLTDHKEQYLLIDGSGGFLKLVKYRDIYTYSNGDRKIKYATGYDKTSLDDNLFDDVDISNRYYDAIKYAKESGIVKGYNDNTFKDKNYVKRSEFVKIIISSLFNDSEINSCDSKTYKFDDVKDSDWASKYICTAKKKFIVNGYDGKTFKQDNNITFAETLKILVNAFKLGTEIKVKNIKAGDQKNSNWYDVYLEIANNHVGDNGNGYAMFYNLNWSPDRYLTRGEIVQLIFNLKSKKSN